MRLPSRNILLTALAAILLIGFVVVSNGPLAGIKVTVASAETADLAPQIFGVGTVEARRSYLIGPTAASRVAKVLVDQGDRVKPGQLLAELDPVDLDERLQSAGDARQRAASAVDVAEAQLREAKSRSALSAASAVRFLELQKKGFVSQEAADAKQHDADATAAASDAAAAALIGSRRDYARLSAEQAGVGRQRAQYHLQSPIAGLVTAREAEPGSTLVAGQALLRLIDPASLWVKTRIDQSRAGGIAVGQPAQIVLRSRPQAALAGHVVRIEANSDSVTEEGLVEVGFASPPPDLSVGELAEVTIQLPPLKNALTVPSAAVRRVGKESGVWRIKDDKTIFVPIRVGMQTLEGRTQVLDGLAPGDRVIHHAPQELHAGEKVRVVDSLILGGS
jgi:HlyD family secretion protein